VIGTAAYVSSVNQVYKKFNWFVPINVEQVHQEIGTRSLGKYLADFFKARFERSLDKIGVAMVAPLLLAAVRFIQLAPVDRASPQDNYRRFPDPA